MWTTEQKAPQQIRRDFKRFFFADGTYEKIFQIETSENTRNVLSSIAERIVPNNSFEIKSQVVL